MLHVNTIVEGLAETDCDRLEKGKEAVEERGTEIRVVNEVVRDAVDVPRDADGIKEAEDQHHPERDYREKKEHPEEVGAVKKRGQNRDRIPAGKGKNPGGRPEPLGSDIIDSVHEGMLREKRAFRTNENGPPADTKITGLAAAPT
jgi:hypothetical protein